MKTTILSSVRRVSLLLLPLLCQLAPSFAQEEKGAPAFVRDSLDRYVERALSEWQIPGAAVCIVKDGHLAVMKGYGVRELGKADRVDENTLFLIGSNTKAFTATALAMLDHDKKLSLDDRVAKWLPDFTLNNELASHEVIVRDLLCHRLGLETFQGDFTYWTSDLSREDVMHRLGRINALYGFRARWGYTNAAFLTAGEIIPKVTGAPWETFVKDSLFSPLEMNRTHALAADMRNDDNAAKAHTLVHGKVVEIPYGNIDDLAPAASIGSSVNDMSHWITAQLDSGRYRGKEVIPPSVIQATRAPQSILGARGGSRFTRGHFSLYGLGWFLEEYDGRLVVSHTGGVNGFVTSVTLLPEEKLGIVVLTNTDQNSFYSALKYEIMDAYLGLPYRNYDSISYGFFRKSGEQKEKWWKEKQDTIAMNLKPALALDRYAGDYQNDVYGDMHIALENGKLVMHFSHHAMVGNLEALGGNRFFCTYSDPEMGMKEIPFTVDGDKVRSVTVHVDDFVEFTPYEFMKK